MRKFYITKQFDFEMAHALTEYSGKCRNIHGHSYKFEVTVTGNREMESGMVIDFKKLKDIVNETIVNQLDHCLVLNKNVDAELIDAVKRNFERVKIVDFQPSTENLLDYFADLLLPKLPNNVHLYSMRLQETEQSWVELRIDE